MVHSWKSYTAHEIRKLLSENKAGETPALPGGKLWQEEYWDRFIRDERHFINTIEYIHQNPVKARLCNELTTWPWSSAYKV
ncbi:hypothetical protein PQO03_07295 [Lentisphaera profundi]|uniref:Transposase IS200-like domain-containing protein n=1 Tax=Lentisphaera profundi TaxID=1658616 RepID=A0ABY7VNM3_9BACT|nr:hypothetical protein [Lentisphaera profundi]WDE95522.1 hypothetical protein PQO03_07295 [Lentisphaera profundi]